MSCVGRGDAKGVVRVWMDALEEPITGGGEIALEELGRGQGTERRHWNWVPIGMGFIGLL